MKEGAAAEQARHDRVMKTRVCTLQKSSLFVGRLKQSNMSLEYFNEGEWDAGGGVIKMHLKDPPLLFGVPRLALHFSFVLWGGERLARGLRGATLPLPHPFSSLSLVCYLSDGSKHICSLARASREIDAQFVRRVLGAAAHLSFCLGAGGFLPLLNLLYRFG